MRSKSVSLRTYEAHRIKLISLRLATAILGLVAVGAISELFFGNVDLCGGVSGWWIGAVFISPLIFVGMCTWCATVVRGETEKSTWATVAGLLMLLYFYGVAHTVISAGGITAWC
ncbi:MAG: hypothetical protein U9N79_06055 [Actinomycetota bacterium]|nr:hypothetical protein [Actinomycetota bacterium]